MIKQLTIFFLIIYFVLPVTVRSFSSSISVSPAVIDVKAKPRDILEASLVLANLDNFKQTVYIFVNNISVSAGKQEFLDPAKADKATSLANWIEISRAAITLAPGEKRKIDFLIKVDLSAAPGVYHANIFFAPGGTRAEAEAKLDGAPALAVNLEILDEVRESAELKKFKADRIFFAGWPVSFLYWLKNTGSRPLSPSGEIRIYNRKGEEVAALVLGQDGAAAAPGEIAQSRIVWNDGKRFGRYKAILDINYGSRDRRTLYDVVFFWVIPIKKILAIFGSIITFAAILIIFINKKYEKSRA